MQFCQGWSLTLHAMVGRAHSRSAELGYRIVREAMVVGERRLGCLSQLMINRQRQLCIRRLAPKLHARRAASAGVRPAAARRHHVQRSPPRPAPHPPLLDPVTSAHSAL